MDDRAEQPTADPTEEQAMTETAKLDDLLPESPADGAPLPPQGSAASGEPGAPTAPGAPGAPEPADFEAEPRRRSPSVPTIVWGLLFGLIAAAVMVGQVSEVDLNLDVSAPAALLVAGIALVLWGIAGLGRSRRT
jgi:hypothetical protein